MLFVTSAIQSRPTSDRSLDLAEGKRSLGGGADANFHARLPALARMSLPGAVLSMNGKPCDTALIIVRLLSAMQVIGGYMEQ